MRRGHLEFGLLGSDCRFLFYIIAFRLHLAEAISYQPLDMMLFSNLYHKPNCYVSRGIPGVE